jgi:hypothetical protein
MAVLHLWGVFWRWIKIIPHAPDTPHRNAFDRCASFGDTRAGMEIRIDRDLIDADGGVHFPAPRRAQGTKRGGYALSLPAQRTRKTFFPGKKTQGVVRCLRAGLFPSLDALPLAPYGARPGMTTDDPRHNPVAAAANAATAFRSRRDRRRRRCGPCRSASRGSAACGP